VLLVFFVAGAMCGKVPETFFGVFRKNIAENKKLQRNDDFT